MKISFKHAVPIALMMTSAYAMADGQLTPHQCHAYPFVHADGPVTHRDLMRELTELESVGYRPGVDNYSLDITQAREKLKAKYDQDCLPKQPAASLPSTNG
ncbi:DUF4148 domain-containing protein [Paraburkholderia sp.]|jgi:hypothetical protein|uniref:DUF4148 domain-containing protein n=1 Tax=Paraburkholderia sp. TaxID=1926495 RepID=UPI002F41453B